MAEAAGSVVDILFEGKPEVTEFASLAAVETLYTRTVPPSRRGELVGLSPPCMLKGMAPLRRDSLQKWVCALGKAAHSSRVPAAHGPPSVALPWQQARLSLNQLLRNDSSDRPPMQTSRTRLTARSSPSALT